MRYLVENVFVAHECSRNGTARAPIPTNIGETYAQCNEDLIVEAILREVMRKAGRDMRSITYMEIGANNPIQTSSTYLLYRLYEASGVLVEANPDLIPALQQVRWRDTIVNCAVTASRDKTIELHIHEKHELSSLNQEHIGIFEHLGGKRAIQRRVTCRNLHINDLLSSHGGRSLDLLSVDIEGLDLEVLSAMDPDYAPTVIQCEHEREFDKFAAVLGPRGYISIGITDVNAIFIHRTAVLR